MQFNPAPPRVMHIDLNSCFASVEQQANPLYRGKPLVVAAYTTDRGCILASSREAKKLGIKTGMRVAEGKAIFPGVIVLPSDPPKYRFVNRKLRDLFGRYTPYVEVKSIDEMVLRFEEGDMVRTAREIKERIRRDIGEWLTVSVGISTNRYLAKVASNLHKPDGLDVIYAANVESVLAGLALEDLTGIKAGYGGRLRSCGINSALEFYRAAGSRLRYAFMSKIGADWALMLHGWESPLFDRDEVKTIGHSYALRIPYTVRDIRLHQILCQLVEKMGRRLREQRFFAQGMHLWCAFDGGRYWNHGEKHQYTLTDSRDLYREALRILLTAPNLSVRLLSVSVSMTVVPGVLTHRSFLAIYLIILGAAKVAGAIALIFRKNWGADLLVALTLIMFPFQFVQLIRHPSAADFFYIFTGLFIAFYLINFRPDRWAKHIVHGVRRRV